MEGIVFANIPVKVTPSNIHGPNLQGSNQRKVTTKPLAILFLGLVCSFDVLPVLFLQKLPTKLHVCLNKHGNSPFNVIERRRNLHHLLLNKRLKCFFCRNLLKVLKRLSMDKLTQILCFPVVALDIFENSL